MGKQSRLKRGHGAPAASKPKPEEKPPLDIQVGHDLANGNVLIQMSQAVQYFVLPPALAKAWGQKVVENADAGLAIQLKTGAKT